MANDLIMEFGFSGNGGAYCGTGWSEPEGTGTWMLGQQSLLVLARPETKGDYRIEFDMGVLTGPGHPSQRFAVGVNGTAVGDFMLSDESREHCVLPWSVVGREPGLTLVLSHPDAWRPAELSGGEGDQREMSFFLRSARLSLHQAVPMAAPAVPAAAVAAAPARPAAAAPDGVAPMPATRKPVAPAPVAAKTPAPAPVAPAPKAAPTQAAPAPAASRPSTAAPPVAPPAPRPPSPQPAARPPAPAALPPSATPLLPVAASPPVARPTPAVVPPAPPAVAPEPRTPAPEPRVPWWKKLLG